MTEERVIQRMTPKERVVEFRPIRGTHGDRWEMRFAGEKSFAGRLTWEQVEAMSRPLPQEGFEL